MFDDVFKSIDDMLGDAKDKPTVKELAEEVWDTGQKENIWRADDGNVWSADNGKSGGGWSTGPTPKQQTHPNPVKPAPPQPYPAAPRGGALPPLTKDPEPDVCDEPKEQTVQRPSSGGMFDDIFFK